MKRNKSVCVLGRGAYARVECDTPDASTCKKTFRSSDETLVSALTDIETVRWLQLANVPGVVLYTTFEAVPPSMVMPRAAQDLSSFATKRSDPIPHDTQRSIARQLAHTLSSAHAVGTIHRDVKLNNILLSPTTEDGRVTCWLTDWGLARTNVVDGGDTYQTRRSVSPCCGTITTMAPEQILHMAGKLTQSPQCDVFSYAACLLQLGMDPASLSLYLTGTPNSSDAENTHSLLFWHSILGSSAFSRKQWPALHEFAASRTHFSGIASSFLLTLSHQPSAEPKALSAVAPHLAPDLLLIVERALRPNPDLRPSMQEIAAELGLSPPAYKISPRPFPRYRQMPYAHLYRSMCDRVRVDPLVVPLAHMLLAEWAKAQAITREDIFLAWWVTAALFNSYALQPISHTIGPMARRSGVALSSSQLASTALTRRWNPAATPFYSAWFATTSTSRPTASSS